MRNFGKSLFFLWETLLQPCEDPSAGGHNWDGNRRNRLKRVRSREQVALGERVSLAGEQ